MPIKSLFRSRLYNLSVCLLLFFLWCTVAGCAKAGRVQRREIPALPTETLSIWGGKAKVRLPFAVQDTKLPIVGYTAGGEPDYQVYNEVVFPTDVWIVLDDGIIRTFLARSPHGGCFILWDEEKQYFHDPCYGSRFTEDGKYIEGPAQRDLDQLPARMENGMIWITNEIVYGEPLN